MIKKNDIVVLRDVPYRAIYAHTRVQRIGVGSIGVVIDIWDEQEPILVEVRSIIDQYPWTMLPPHALRLHLPADKIAGDR